MKKHLLIAMLLSFSFATQAGMFPKLLTQIPAELHGDYSLLIKVKPDKSKEVFTNALPFATICSNRIVFASGIVRTVESVMKVSQKGTNVYAISFQDKTSWLITPVDSVSKLAVLEPTAKRSKEATIFVIRRMPITGSATNAISESPQ